ncbi:MAG: hypothetical protein JWQ79_4038 [Mucilaginibacter sp.]|nr:hypothetical protein [Mucilaginibacter sp.]
MCCVCLLLSFSCFAQRTIVSGVITDSETGQPVPHISITFANTHTGSATDSLGKFILSASGSFSRIVVSAVGYKSLIRIVSPGADNEVYIKLEKSQTQLKEVAVTARGTKPYRNKDNPAVELIRQVIAHKDANRAQSANYLQYDQYERIGLTLFDIPPVLINNFLFRPYRFMLDTIGGKLSAEVYLSEKRYRQYVRKEPEKSIKVLLAQKESNIIKFIDTAGVNIYLNRLYGNQVDIYENNIFIINNQLLSPIANHSPDFYKFFITDTIRSGKDTLVELSFVARNKGDLLFEGHLLVTLNGTYAVTSCELTVNSHININFLRSLKVNLDFQKQPSGRYFLIKSDAKADFGILKNKGFGVTGERTIYYSNYLIDQPLDQAFYQGKSEQVLPDFSQPATAYWAKQRPDTLPKKEVDFYRHIGRLEKMKSFKRATWIASTLNGGFADVGPFQFNAGNFVSYNTLEGLRLVVGGRTTPKFNKTIYLEGYLADGTLDHRLKYNATGYYSFNKTPYYRYPNDYLKISQQYDIGIPGGNTVGGNFRTPLSSFQTGTNRYYFYSHDFKLDYVKEYDNHFSFDAGFSHRIERATGALMYTLNDPQQTVVNQITSSVFTLLLRYAPHEQIFQGTNDRNTIRYKYPIFTLLLNQGVKGIFNGTNNYNAITATIVKRFYLSQLGFADVTLLGGLIIGKVPYPLLNISTANQSIVYDPNAYNQMHYLEFVNDHYAGLNITQSFNGFLLNKVPLIDHLKWREYLSFKVLYGGLRAENNPMLTGGLYNFPVPAAGTTGTYTLGNVPYTEAGVGIGNIFKVLRVDGIRRFNYLDHPGVSKYGVKFTLNVDL